MVTAAFIGLPIFVAIWICGVWDVYVEGFTVG